jgi:hypothetical protein
MNSTNDREPEPIFQAGHAGSIPVARSAEYPLQQVYSIYCSTDRRQVPAVSQNDIHADIYPVQHAFSNLFRLT